MITNDVQLKSMTYNGQEVKTWVHNGVEVWSKATPFYWINNGVVQSGMPTTYTNYTINITSPNSIFNITNLGICGMSDNTRFQGTTNAVNTQGNKYMEIVFNYGSVTDTSGNDGGVLNSFRVANTEYKDKVTENAVITIDVSKLETVTLYVDITAWALNNWAELQIKSIRFYS